nr:glycosyltransferase 87 family protein [uncultured Ruminococcus sp.]
MQNKLLKPRIPSFESKFLGFIEKHVMVIAIIAISAVAIAVRALLFDHLSIDAYNFLIPWYDTLAKKGFAGLSQPVGNYNILYQTIIVLFTYLPIKALHTYKLFSCVFDFLTAGLVAYIVYKSFPNRPRLKALIAYAAVLLSPLVFLNSACWAQCDVIYAFFCIFSVYHIYREKYVSSLILFGVALTFKLQAIFILPFLLFVYLYKKRFSILYFLIIPAVMVVLSLPGLLMGRGFTEIFTIYLKQTSEYKSMAMNYPSFWLLFKTEGLDSFYQLFSTVAVLITFTVLLILMIVWLKKKVDFTLQNVLIMAFLISYTCVLFLPSMHERYGFIYEILGLMLAFWFVKTIPLLVLMYLTSIATYSNYLFQLTTNSTVLCVVNTLVYIAYVIYLNRQLFKEKSVTVPTIES